MHKSKLLLITLIAITLLSGCGKSADTPKDTIDQTKVEEAAVNRDQTDLTIDTPDKQTSETSKKTIVIQGNAPKDAAKITVNDYELKRFKKGQKRWSYVATVRNKTLKEGANDFTIRAFDSEGKEMNSEKISVTYKPETTPILPLVGPNLILMIIGSMILALTGFGLKRVYIIVKK